MKTRFPTVLFTTSVLLRLLLATVNRYAADDHVTVAKRLLLGLSVDKNACWECFQPKLYHATLAFFAYIFSLRNYTDMVILGQFLNALVGIATIWLIWKFLEKYSAPYLIKALCFGLIALNPMFVGINFQATNDAFVIFFGVLSLYLLIQFFSKPTIRNAILLILAVNGSFLSKGNGIVVILATVISLLLQIIGSWTKKISAKPSLYTLIALCLSIFLTTIFFSPYVQYYKKYGDPFVINWTKPPPAKLFTPTYSRLYRPGIITIADGFFTFRFINLLLYPYDTHEYTHYPLHRTSFWSQVYASSQSVFFYGWDNMGWLAQTETRLILLFALFPALLFIAGFVVSCKRVIVKINQQHLQAFYNNADLVIVLYFCLFLFMLIYYAFVWRDFSHMKAIFIYPGLLSMTALLLKGTEYYNKKVTNLLLRRTGALIILLLLGLYAFNIATLFLQFIGYSF